MDRKKTENIILCTLLLLWLLAETAAYVLIVTKIDQKMSFSVSYASIVADALMTLGILVIAVLRSIGGGIARRRLLECIFLFLA